MEPLLVAASAAADAQPIALSSSSASSNIRSWLPAKAQLSMKSRLFSKNVLRSKDVWAAGATPTYGSMVVYALLFVGACSLVYLLLFKPSNATNGKPLWQLSTMLADDATINRLDNQLDSDEYEDEEGSSRSSGFLANSKERLALRKMLGRNDHTLTRRSSIVRITSSDPTSSLCDHPMQVDLEPPTRRSFWPAPASANTPPSDSSTPNSPIIPSPVLAATNLRSSSGSPTPTASRRRKESGRLHTASPSRSPLGSGATRSRSADARSPLSRQAARNKRNSTSSLGATDGASSKSLPTAGKHDAGTEHFDEHDQMRPGTPSMESEASSASAALGHSSAFAQYDHGPFNSSACSSPTSSTFSISRAPSILNRRPQTFRTASLREIDISYSLMQRKESLPFFSGDHNPALVQQQQQQQQEELLQAANGIFLPPLGASSPAPPPYQPNTPTEPAPSWSRTTRTRSIKLVEPDWRPHFESHIRARERLETAMRFAALHGYSSSSVNVDEYGDDQLGDDFWFERFTQSTAAAGRDWDWRKRRARLQRAATLGMALGQSGLASQPGGTLPGNVGLTDVQLQQQQEGAPTPAAQVASPTRKHMPLPTPLITFTEQELKTAPNLKIDTETGRRSLSRGSSEASLSPTAQGPGTPMSPTPSGTGTPLGGIFGAAAAPSADSMNLVMAARVAQRRRASDDANFSQLAAGPQGPKRGVVNKIARRRLSASAAAGIPSSPGPSSLNGNPSTPSVEGGSLFRSYSASSPLAESSSGFEYSGGSSSASVEAVSKPSASLPSSLSVPGRLSSLGGNVGKVSLTHLRAGFRRDSGGNEFLPDSSGIELVPNSPELRDEEPGNVAAYLDGAASSEGPRSSADAYSFASHSAEDREPQSPTSQRSASASSHSAGWQVTPETPIKTDTRPRKAQPPIFRGGSAFGKQTSSPPSTTTYHHHDDIEELRNDSAERDSISRGSNSSDSLRRKMRARSATESSPSFGDAVQHSGAITARKDGLAALSAGLPTSSPPAVRAKARNGSRSSIMRSASGAHVDLDRTARRRAPMRQGSDTSSITGSTGSRSGSVRYSGSPQRTRKDSSAGAVDLHMQPEPAPRGMAQRARSASLSSNASSSLTSRDGSRTASRSNSFREGGAAGAGMLGLSMTSSGAAA